MYFFDILFFFYTIFIFQQIWLEIVTNPPKMNYWIWIVTNPQ